MSDIITTKQLAALAKACRKAGITSFKGHGIEFTLELLPQRDSGRKSKAQSAPKDLGPNEIQSDELSPEALLFWSTGGENQEEASA